MKNTLKLGCIALVLFVAALFCLGVLSCVVNPVSKDEVFIPGLF